MCVCPCVSVNFQGRHGTHHVCPSSGCVQPHMTCSLRKVADGWPGVACDQAGLGLPLVKARFFLAALVAGPPGLNESSEPQHRPEHTRAFCVPGSRDAHNAALFSPRPPPAWGEPCQPRGGCRLASRRTRCVWPEMGTPALAAHWVRGPSVKSKRLLVCRLPCPATQASAPLLPPLGLLLLLLSLTSSSSSSSDLEPPAQTLSQPRLIFPHLAFVSSFQWELRGAECRLSCACLTSRPNTVPAPRGRTQPAQVGE